MTPRKIIIDTDPGVDDTFALLLALSASQSELEVPLITATFGNIDVECALRNLISLFHIINLEQKWRISNSLSPGFEALAVCKPIVAVGASTPIENATLEYDYFHGTDGLSGVHTDAPHFTPSEMWSHLFSPSDDANAPTQLPPNFTPSAQPAHKEVLNILRSNPPDTITLLALGPLTNFALAADDDPATFLRAREVVVMGGTLDLPGNVTPMAEFNHYACAYSAARIYALTGPSPNSMLPPCRQMLPYPSPLPGSPLKLTLIPLDITTPHLLNEVDFLAAAVAPASKGSPLAEWMQKIIGKTFLHARTLYTDTEVSGVSLHDPLTVWWVLRGHNEGWVVRERMDIRVEAEGQWTRGMVALDRRNYIKEEDVAKPMKKHDRDTWLHASTGNRVRVVMDGPDKELFGKELVRRIFAALK